MHCYTLVLGGVPERGIRLAMSPKHKVPVVAVGDEDGPTIPLDPAWFDTIINLQTHARALPECQGKQLSLPTILNCDLEGVSPQEYRLVARPGDEPDRRALVHLKPPDEGRVQYSGRYRLEAVDNDSQKVVAHFPKLEDVVGIEVIAIDRGEALIIMHPGSGFRVTHPRWGGGPGLHMYRLTASASSRPKVIDVTRRDDKAA